MYNTLFYKNNFIRTPDSFSLSRRTKSQIFS